MAECYGRILDLTRKDHCALTSFVNQRPDDFADSLGIAYVVDSRDTTDAQLYRTHLDRARETWLHQHELENEAEKTSPVIGPPHPTRNSKAQRSFQLGDVA